MNETTYAGIDYGLGRTNAEQGTDIRFGVISQHSLAGHVYDAVELDYGDASCPKCGEKANEQGDFDYFAECGVWQCIECDRVCYPMELQEGDVEGCNNRCPECAGICKEAKFDQYSTHQCEDHVCLRCNITFGSECAYPDEPVEQRLEDTDFLAKDCLQTDWVVLKSRFITRTQFCSPCVPGAGNLDTPCESGPVTLCFGHSWFEGDLAPYPVVEREPYLKDGTLSMVLSDGSCRQYQNWETIFAVWQMRKGV